MFNAKKFLFQNVKKITVYKQIKKYFKNAQNDYKKIK